MALSSVWPSIQGPNKIVLKAHYNMGGAEHEEGPLKGAYYPGMNVTVTGDTDAQGRQSYQASGSDWAGTGTNVTTTKNPLWILKEDVLQGKTATQAYVSGENGFIHMCLPGDVVQVLVLSGETIVKGSGMSATSVAANIGKFVNDSTNAACIALDNSGGALGADTLMRVRVL